MVGLNKYFSKRALLIMLSFDSFESSENELNSLEQLQHIACMNRLGEQLFWFSYRRAYMDNLYRRYICANRKSFLRYIVVKDLSRLMLISSETFPNWQECWRRTSDKYESSFNTIPCEPGHIFNRESQKSRTTVGGHTSREDSESERGWSKLYKSYIRGKRK